ncbi:retropepsin-like aspartic protease [Gluconacetobacter diazotrophicus]|uniref:Putative exported protein n=1 Tax=Gluconacetobacter diazotrophicus (strain ATCC 49037 / DSM 5601 / CCUG 37298 / CIP 103539 / LMG 7603 / PAl5) TaxID=272568 RepID=A9H344_GLUDA|nr:retropepsin-like aspartic protease [Gluconacetobacter diazotrophicus]CAP54237.1 putative exported protein [Gluconacetobacter diazotrophicus PA1 5]
MGRSRPAAALSFGLAAAFALPLRAQPAPVDDGRPVVVPSRCVAHVLSAPLLTGDGSPGIPVTIDGTDGLAFLGLTQENLGVFERPDVTYPPGTPIKVRTMTGEGTVYETVVRKLALGHGTARDVQAVMLGTTGDRRVAGRPLLGIVGYDILGNYDVLLDFPDRTLTLFQATGAAGCPPVSRLVGGPAYAAPLLPNSRGMSVMVQVAIGGVPIGMELEPGSNASLIQASEAADIGVDAAALAADPRSRTDAGNAIIGHRHRFGPFVLGTYRGTDLTADVTRSTTNILGMNFFRGRRVLFAMPTRMVYFSDPQATQPGQDTASAGASPAQSRLADVAVQDPPAAPP